MRKDTAIVFSATFIGVVTAISTFNILIENNLLPSKDTKLAAIDVEPVKARAEEIVRAAETSLPISVETTSHLDTVVEKALANTKGKYSVAIKNVKTGETFYKDENEVYPSASLYKLWVMGTTYEQVKEGTLKEDDVLSASVPDLNRQFGIASESAEQTQGTVTLSVKSALQQMITISHNYAALLLSSKVKLANVKDYLANHDLKASKTGSPPQTTAADTLAFYEKLYKGELADSDYSSKMLDLLKRQKLNNKLPRYLPKNTVIAHKTGELGSVSHDAGIVYTEKGDYIIVILSDTTYPKGAEDRIANISKDVYAYFLNK